MSTDPTWTLLPHRGNGVFKLTSVTQRVPLAPNRVNSWPGCSATIERIDDTTTRVWFQPAEGKPFAYAIAAAHEFAASVFAFVAETDEEVDAGNIERGVEASAVVHQGLDKGGATVFVDVTHERGEAPAVVGAYFDADELFNAMT